jgi:hypothetical protein
MSETAFHKAADDLVDATKETFNRPSPLPEFILLYSSIDILSSLTRSIGSDDTSGTIFQEWVKKYLLPGSLLPCNEMDLWGARCGFLHTYTVQSKLSRHHKIRELHYVSKERKFVKFAQQKIDPRAEEKVFIFLPDLIFAFSNAVDRFKQEVKADVILKNVVSTHAAKLIIHERKEIPR